MLIPRGEPREAGVCLQRRAAEPHIAVTRAVFHGGNSPRVRGQQWPGSLHQILFRPPRREREKADQNGQELGAKDLSQSKLTDAEIEKQVREGRAGEDGKIQMPSFKDAFTPEEAKAPAAWVNAFRK